MNTQKNPMMFTILISAIYLVWSIFAPRHILNTYITPPELINPLANNIVMLFGVAACFVNQRVVYTS